VILRLAKGRGRRSNDDPLTPNKGPLLALFPPWSEPPFARLVLTSTPPPVSIVSDGRGINRQTAAKAASPQNGADRGLDDAQIDRNLVLRPARFAQRLDLGDQALVDNLRSRNRKASRPASFRCVNCNRLVVSRGSPSRSSPDRQGKASKSRRIHFLRCLRQIGKGGEGQDRP
jgi:hypothetical protein